MGGNEVLLLNNNKKSEQLELLPWSVWLNWLLAVKQLDGTKLLVRYAKHADIAILRKKRFYALYMHLGIFYAGAMADVNRELEHRETVTLQILAEKSISLLVPLCFCREVKENKYPHNPVFAETIGHDI